MDTPSMTPADIMALSGNDGLGGNNWLAFLIIFAMIFGTGGFGFGGNAATALGYENLATSAEVQRGFDAQNSMANEREILAAVNTSAAQGIQAGAQNMQYLSGQLTDKYGELQRDMGGLAVGQANLLASVNECCGSTQRLVMQGNYDLASRVANGNAALATQIAQNEYNNAMRDAATNANFTAQIQGLKDAWYEDKISGLQQEVGQLRTTLGNQGIQSQLDAIQANMVTYPRGWTYNAGNSPFCGCNNGCNCI